MRKVELGDLESFATVARHRSFRGAAREAGVSASTLSQAIRDLEDRLGTRLLNRTTRSVAPTELGARLLERLAPALGEIAEAVDQARAVPGAPAGTVRINAPQPAIELVLAPLVARFLAEHPLVRLEVVAEPSLVDIVATGFDAGIRWGEDLPQDMVAVPIGPRQRYVLVATPERIAASGRPAHPGDLLALPCIRLLFPGGVQPAWEFERAGEVLRLRPEGVLVTTNIALQLQAARDGVGFLAIFEDYVRADIEAGRLIPVLEDWLPDFPGPYLYYPRQRQVPAPLRALVGFLRRIRTG